MTIIGDQIRIWQATVETLEGRLHRCYPHEELEISDQLSAAEDVLSKLNDYEERFVVED